MFNIRPDDIKPISKRLPPGTNLIELPIILGTRRYILYIKIKNTSTYSNIIEIHASAFNQTFHPGEKAEISNKTLLYEDSLEPSEISEIPRFVVFPPSPLFSYSNSKLLFVKNSNRCNIFMNYMDW